MANAVCIRCGRSKRGPLSKCQRCGYSPRGDEEATARSLLLSVERYEDGDDRHRYRSELEHVGQCLEKGEEVHIDELEIRRRIRILRLGQQANWRDALKAFFGVMWWLWPLWLLALLGLYLALR